MHPNTGTFGNDDDTIMSSLLTRLDISSAVNRLVKVGFKLIASSKTSSRHHLTRKRDSMTIEEIYIALDATGNRFIIQHASNGLAATSIQIINTWDEWVEFVRLLAPRSCVVKNTRMAEI